MEEKKNKNSIIELIVLFLILFLSNSFVVCNDIISTPITIALWVMTFLIIIVLTKRINSILILYLVVFMTTMCITTVFKNENLVTFGMVLFSYIVALLYVNYVGFELFCKQYTKIMYFLCIISLIGFFSYNIFPILYRINQVTTYTTYSNLYLYVDTQRYNRNMGMFWEPGAFQTFVIFALLVELSNTSEKFRFLHVSVYVLTIITTYSTTGYIALILSLATLYVKRGKSEKTNAFLLVFTIVLLSALYLGQDYLFGTVLNNGQSTVFGKIFTFFSGGKVQSVSVRYYSIIKPIEAFLKSPIIGNGRTSLANDLFYYTNGMNTCTFINWFAIYGIFYGAVMIKGTVKFSSLLSHNNRLLCLWYVLIMFITTISETYIDNPMLFLFILYGLKPIDDINNKNDINSRRISNNAES